MVVSGILPLGKPAGMTSHDCVLLARRWFRTREVGHTGTLDPGVEGVLPLCIGRATKLVPILMESSKTYEGTIALGTATTTEDAGGEVISRARVREEMTDEELQRVFDSLSGDIQQVPPMYSAVKVKGKRLYEYARAGETVERPLRTVTVHAFHRSGEATWSRDGQHLIIPFSVACSKGTYVRTLAVEAGERLGYPAHLAALKRTKSACIELAQCTSMAEMDQWAKAGRAEQALFSVEHVLRHYQHWAVSAREAEKVKNGAVLRAGDYPYAERLVLTHADRALAIYAPHPKKQGMIKPEVMLSLDEGREK